MVVAGRVITRVARRLSPGVLVPHNLHKGTHGASEAGPDGTADTIWRQVRGLQDTTAAQEDLHHVQGCPGDGGDCCPRPPLVGRG